MPSNFQRNAILFLNSQFNLHFQPSNKQQGRGKGSTLIIIFKKLKYYQVHVEVRACGRGGGGAGGEERWQEGPGCVSGSEQLLLYSHLFPFFIMTLSQILTREPRVHQIQSPAMAAAAAAPSPGWTGTTSPTTAARTLTGTITGQSR